MRFGRVALLSGDLVIVFKNAVDDAGEGFQLGAPGRSLPPVTRRDGVGQHLPYSVPVQPEHLGGFPDAHALHHHRPADPQIRFHLVHSWHHPWVENDPMDGGRRYDIQPPFVSDLSAHVVQFNSADYIITKGRDRVEGGASSTSIPVGDSPTSPFCCSRHSPRTALPSPVRA